MSKLYSIGSEVVADIVIFITAFALSTGVCTTKQVNCGHSVASPTPAQEVHAP